MCKFCYEDNERIAGRTIRTDEWQNTAGYNPERNRHYFYQTVRAEAFEQLEAFILKGENDKKAGLFINTISGARFIDINYCPMCGRKLED